MRRLSPSPRQHHLIDMARLMLEWGTWHRRLDRPIDFERAMLIDYAVRYPRAVIPLVPEVQRVLRGRAIADGDLADLFARRRLDSVREEFAVIVQGLLARGLADEVTPDLKGSPGYALTHIGLSLSESFSSEQAQTIRALAEIFANNWKSKKVSDLHAAMRGVVPRESTRLG